MSVSHSPTPYPLSSGAPHTHISLHSLTELPDRYWYNPRSGCVVISKLAPCPDADLILANILPGQPQLDLVTVKRIYEEQLVDSCKQSGQQGSCDTREKKEKRVIEYKNQKPTQKLEVPQCELQNE